MKIGRGGIATTAIVAIVVIVVVVVAVVAVLLLKPAVLKPAVEVKPKPSATLTGAIDISGKASSGMINFTISEDGASVTYLSITLNDVDVDVFSAESMTTEQPCSFPVTGGAFSDSVSGIGDIEGQFTSPTEASGTINLLLEIYQVGTVEFGKCNWSAKTS